MKEREIGVREAMREQEVRLQQVCVQHISYNQYGVLPNMLLIITNMLSWLDMLLQLVYC